MVMPLRRAREGTWGGSLSSIPLRREAAVLATPHTLLRERISRTQRAMETDSTYDRTFFERESASSGASAEVIVPLLTGLLQPRSVLDVGCGTGSFLARFTREGIEDVVGVEGEWARTAPLRVGADHLRFLDLNRPFDLGRAFDLVLCLEVAEHVEPENADTLVDSLSRHGPSLAFSAAVPSQGGTHHVNMQWPEYWAEKFRRRGYIPFDALRPRILRDERVAVYYAQNSIIYARPGSPGFERLRAVGPPISGRVPFVLRESAHPWAARWLNRAPARIRERFYATYRERMKRHMPGRFKDLS